ncbi:MAG: TIM barrel protein [Fuerstiella sp.]|nr:TIM barrel protein [Fuerstiella sp.]MCP4855606.1 TIM barrel protein [Fuerstiella sp.]
MRRRDFLYRTSAVLAAAAVPNCLLAANSSNSTRIPLGLDGHSMRGMKWKATQQIEFAAEQRLDAVLLNSLNYFESLEESHLLKLKQLADRHEMRIYMGAGGICENGAKFSDKWGNAESMLATGIRVAKTVGSPVVNVRIGSIDDRFLEGGIQPRIDEAVRVLKASSQRAKDAGVKFGFENHAADLRSEELLALVNEVGTDVCGVMLDPGNGLWAMEDPMKHLETLAPHVVCNSLRDYTVWESEEGATFQWRAVGDGLMDVPAYVQRLSEANPGMPVFVESISNSNRPIPFLTKEHWKGYPNLKATNIVDFLALCRRGQASEIDMPATDMDQKEFDRQHQRAEFLKSIAYLRQHCGAGLKPGGN